MDGREAMALSGGSAPYYIHTGVGGSSSGSVTHTGVASFHSQPGFRPLSNPQIQLQSNVCSNFTGELKNSSLPRGTNIDASSGMPPAEPVKKKRGRPRKYAPDGQVSLGLLPMSAKPKPSSRSDASGQKRNRGRPPGTGRKQQLAALGEWMNSSAGQAFAPHVVTVGIGEDVVAKMLSFAQQRPRAVCILSGSGTVSSVTLRQPASSTPTVTYEGHFEILCLSGSYLLAEDGGPHSRTGGISAALSTSDGHVIGGGVATLVALSLVQLVVCSFTYGGSKTKTKQLASPQGSKDSAPSKFSNKSAMEPLAQNFAPPSTSIWPGSMPVDLRYPHTDIDLTRG
ncbi:AT-hook motif nuclear-localized protein 5-like [Hibiscus syriacus]|uniref:AT-hook motif nuclear-localized protein 5-like n=1 Tax=Hibiscus syriacus TaxID=106335 RepID=UPI0019214EA9|nr:AT-hook motif nuclear-localized protein 5-like [Hibiscus syriacus]